MDCLFFIAIIATVNSPQICVFCREQTANFLTLACEKCTALVIDINMSIVLARNKAVEIDNFCITEKPEDQPLRHRWRV